MLDGASGFYGKVVHDTVSELWDVFTGIAAFEIDPETNIRAERLTGDAPIHVTWDIDVRSIPRRIINMTIDGDPWWCEQPPTAALA